VSKISSTINSVRVHVSYNWVKLCHSKSDILTIYPQYIISLAHI